MSGFVAKIKELDKQFGEGQVSLDILIKTEAEYWDKVPNTCVGPLRAEELAQKLKEFLTKNNINISNCRLLDFGCGIGRFYHALKTFTENFSYTGADISKILLKHASLTVPNLVWLNNSILPFLDEYFDFCIAYSVFTHIEKNQREVLLSELSRVIKPNGFLLCSILGLEAVLEVQDSNWILCDVDNFIDSCLGKQLKLIDSTQFKETEKTNQTVLLFKKE